MAVATFVVYFPWPSSRTAWFTNVAYTFEHGLVGEGVFFPIHKSFHVKVLYCLE